VTTDVKLTPAAERHVHFPASMHDVPPEARRKNEARVGARKPEGYAREEGDAHRPDREERTRERHKCSTLFWRGRRAPIAGRGAVCTDLVTGRSADEALLRLLAMVLSRGCVLCASCEEGSVRRRGGVWVEAMRR
jgi:hypothetical protein